MKFDIMNRKYLEFLLDIERNFESETVKILTPEIWVASEKIRRVIIKKKTPDQIVIELIDMVCREENHDVEIRLCFFLRQLVSIYFN